MATCFLSMAARVWGKFHLRIKPSAMGRHWIGVVGGVITSAAYSSQMA